MNPTSQTTEPVYSTFADDPDFDELLELFLESIAEKRAHLTESFDGGDFEQLRTVAHQLKGAGGGYGFDGLTEVARELENACKADVADVDRIGEELDRVFAYMSRITIV